ncbi:MAG: amidohydrolase family protein [Bacteroidales bacterium]
MKPIALICALSLTAVMGTGCSGEIDFQTFPKVDAHVHLETSDDAFTEVLRQNNMRLITLVTRSNPQPEIEVEYSYAKMLYDHHPDQIAYATTFSMEDFGEPEWEERTLEWLAKSFDDGAIALKVWKDIGMTFREPGGAFILIDDPRFDPIFDYVESRGLTLVNHNAEPKNCWLPVEEMTVKGDSSYFTNNPQYHMYLHPEYPSYEELIAARDRMLEKHPGLKYVGCHLGSQEWDVDFLARSLDQFPNMSVDMAARIPHFKIQDRDKVREFIIKYQDRLLYGTDIGIRGKGDPGWSADQAQHSFVTAGRYSYQPGLGWLTRTSDGAGGWIYTANPDGWDVDNSVFDEGSYTYTNGTGGFNVYGVKWESFFDHAQNATYCATGNRQLTVCP